VLGFSGMVPSCQGPISFEIEWRIRFLEEQDVFPVETAVSSNTTKELGKNLLPEAKTPEKPKEDCINIQ